MPVDLRETRLPGVGVKYTFRTALGGRVAVIMHVDGQREIYFYRRADDDEPTAVIELHDDESRQLGAIIGGAYERPKIVEELEMALGELHIEWIPVPDTSPAIGLTLADCASARSHGGYGDRDSSRARAGQRCTARGRRPAGRHPRRSRQGGAVRRVPATARRGPVRRRRRLARTTSSDERVDGRPVRAVDGAEDLLGLLDLEPWDLGDDVLGRVENRGVARAAEALVEVLADRGRRGETFLPGPSPPSPGRARDGVRLPGAGGRGRARGRRPLARARSRGGRCSGSRPRPPPSPHAHALSRSPRRRSRPP